MEKLDFSTSISVTSNPKQAFEKIARVGDWWAKSFTGKAMNVDDEFRIEFGSTWVNFKITEALSDEKIVWYVTDSYLPWLNDKTEWNNTSISWEISKQDASSTIKMTHLGLVPGIECYENCERGWTRFVTVSLRQFISEGKGLPE